MTRTQVSIYSPDIRMEQGVPFVKMQALGNDFVFVQESDLRAVCGSTIELEELCKKLAPLVCHRHFGIGADGLIIARPPGRDDCQIGWLYFNSDGSQSNMCGNGLRCLALYAQVHELVDSHNFAVDTAVGPVAVEFKSAQEITTDLGKPFLNSRDIPVAGAVREPVVRESLTVAGRALHVTCVGMGNPHAAIFDFPEGNEQERLLAPLVQQNALFPEGVNVEFVTVVAPTRAKVFVWERGCGPTLACASGAAAVLVAGVLEERLERTAVIELPGGPLTVSWSSKDDHVRITGPAAVSYSGQFSLKQYLGAEVRDV